MDFLISNDVEFQVDPEDRTYIATIKIVNKPGQNQQDDYGQEIINGMDQMRQFSKQGSGRKGGKIDDQTILRN